jgi:hypothetical protein
MARFSIKICSKILTVLYFYNPKNINKMKKIERPQLLPYLGRFTLLFLATYYVIGLPFLVFQSALPESGRIALDFYETFRPIDLMAVAGQVLRASHLPWFFIRFTISCLKAHVAG